jgi:hypothetical protein
MEYQKTKNVIYVYIYKIREQEGRTGLMWWGWYQQEGDKGGKGCGRMNMVQMLYNHLCKWKKMRPVENIWE